MLAGAGLTTYPVPTPDARPYQIVAGPDGALWFTELEGSKIGRVTTSGKFTELPLGADRYPHGLTVASDGAIWFAEQDGNVIGSIDPPDQRVHEYPLPAGHKPAHIVQLGHGDLFFTETGTNSIGRMTLSGRYVASYNALHKGVNGIAVGADGAIWFEESSAKRIGRLDPVTGAVTDFGGLTGSPHHIAAGADGNLWFAEPKIGRVGRITVAGTVTEFAVPGSTATPSHPDTLAPGAGATVLFTDSQLGQIDSLDTATGAISQFQLPDASSRPVGVAIGPDGAIWFCEDAANAVGKLTGWPSVTTLPPRSLAHER